MLVQAGAHHMVARHNDAALDLDPGGALERGELLVVGGRGREQREVGLQHVEVEARRRTRGNAEIQVRLVDHHADHDARGAARQEHGVERQRAFARAPYLAPIRVVRRDRAPGLHEDVAVAHRPRQAVGGEIAQADARALRRPRVVRLVDQPGVGREPEPYRLHRQRADQPLDRAAQHQRLARSGRCLEQHRAALQHDGAALIGARVDVIRDAPDRRLQRIHRFALEVGEGVLVVPFAHCWNRFTSFSRTWRTSRSIGPTAVVSCPGAQL